MTINIISSMSKKAPTSGGKAEPVARVYEEFKPQHEWQETLLIRLPGFKKNDLKVERKNTVIVRGEHHIGENKWKRFREEFPFPKDCVVEAITAKLENGTLAITMPVLTKKQDQQEKETAPKHHVPHKEETQDISPPKTTSSEDHKEPIPQGPPIQNKDPPKLTPPIHPTHETGNNKHDDKAEKAESQIASYRQVIKRLTESNEDKQLLVNAAVAVLVIIALGAYVFRKQVTT